MGLLPDPTPLPCSSLVFSLREDALRTHSVVLFIFNPLHPTDETGLGAQQRGCLGEKTGNTKLAQGLILILWGTCCHG